MREVGRQSEAKKDIEKEGEASEGEEGRSEVSLKDAVVNISESQYTEQKEVD